MRAGSILPPLQAAQGWHGPVKSQLTSNIREEGLGKAFALDAFLLRFSNHSEELPPARNWSYHLKMPFFKKKFQKCEAFHGRC